MSRFNFRIYDTEEKKYFVPVYEAYNNKLLDLSITLAGELLRRTLKEPAEHESMFKNRYVIEQWTGLKDKNIVDVFEGDVIGAIDSEGNPIRHRISFDDGGFTAINIKHGNEGKIRQEWLSMFEVIGNIHQNKELL